MLLITTVECWQAVIMIMRSNEVASSSIMGIITVEAISFPAFVDITMQVIVMRQHHTSYTVHRLAIVDRCREGSPHFARK